MAYLKSLFFHVMASLFCFQTLAIASLWGNHSDHDALLGIKSRVTHDPQHALDTWNASLHFCQWKGVTCGRRHKRVTVLDLGSQGLSGSLAPQIGNLSFLKEIRLTNNSFTGVIPPQVGRLFRLQGLILYNNSFEGEIPTSLSNCTSLMLLGIAGNNLVGKLPPELSSLVNLVTLIIQLNKFTGGISFLGNLTSLETISAFGNHLGGRIPRSLGKLPNLIYIGFGSNQLYGTLPPSFYNISSLTNIDFSDNQISGELPKKTGFKLANLKVFSAWGNQLTGSLPSWFSNCSSLMLLLLDENNFTGKINIDFGQVQNLQVLTLYANSLGSWEPDEMSFIDSMVNCSKLVQLAFAVNRLQGALPSSIGNFTSQVLSILDLGYNSLHGPLPSGIGNLLSLEVLFVGSNQFTGVIPSQLGNLQSLKQLELDHNNFTGKFPDFVGNLSLVLELSMSNNRLEGKLPPNIGNCNSLISLDLSVNNLSGPIPIELFQLTFLSRLLNLSENHFVDTLPREIGKLKQLLALDLSHNDFVGAIPDAIGSCIGLEELYLGANFFQGSLPLSMSALRGIEYLDLSSNNLSGPIPQFLVQLNLSSLNLSFNDFDGAVPAGGIFKNTSAIAIGGNNKLCGGLPELRLPKCVVKPQTDHKKSRVIIVVTSLCSFLVLAIALYLLFCWQKRKRQAHPTRSSLVQSLSKVSYGSILKATDGFSDQNLIGTGSFGAVYKALLEPIGTTVAIKVFKLENQGALKSFVAECEALKNIRHRNLVKVITSCSSVDYQGNDFKALIYEYMSNGNLESWLHPSPEQGNEPPRLNLVQRVTIVTDVAHAIHYLHRDYEVPIIHCDLKPSNILLDGDMVAHIGDFGLARFLPPKPQNMNQSSSIGIRGTVGYAAPEYGVGSEMSRDGDMYSFGILLLEMLTGKRPTDPIFKDNFNLHNHVKMALPDCVHEITDSALMSALEEEINRFQSIKWKRVEECLVLLGRIGLGCSMESPEDRMDINKVISDLNRINGVLQLIFN